MMVHDIDLALAIAGPVDEVSARTLGPPDRERAFARLRHASGAVTDLHASWAEEPGTAFLRADVVSAAGEISFRQAPPVALLVEDGRLVGDDSGLAPYVAQARDIVAAVESGRPPTVRARDAAQAGLVALAALESAVSGRAVELGG